MGNTQSNALNVAKSLNETKGAVDTVLYTRASVEPSAQELATADPSPEVAEKSIAANLEQAVSQPNSPENKDDEKKLEFVLNLRKKV